VIENLSAIEKLNFELSDSIAAEIAVVDATGTIVHSNRKWHETAKVGGLSAKPSGWNYVAECEAAAARGSDEAAAILAGLRSVLSREQPYFVHIYGCPFNGVYHWYQVQISEFDLGGRLYAILMHVDVSAMQRDALTGLANRAMFDVQLDLAFSLVRARERQTGIVIVDINRMKLINDLYGHRVGDEALLAVATAVKRIGGRGCLAARIGGDEFGIILSAERGALAEPRLRANLKPEVVCSISAAGKPVFVSASVGAAFYPHDGATATELLASADGAMYAQKRRQSIA
jgi:diguanylate cyclase (GGDEF)-like protein